MEAASPPREQPEQLTEEAAIAALVVVLLSGLAFASMLGHVQRLLGALGIPAAATRRALALLFPHLAPPGEAAEDGDAAAWLRRTKPARQAAYLLKASKRLASGGSEDAERTYLRQHLNAERARREAVARVDAAALQWGPVLGWHSRRDEIVTPACKAAHGRNFRAERPPAIGWPGTLHAGACRCRPGAPFPAGRMMD